MADLAISGYAVDDLDWLRDAIGVAHLELDPWGSLIVSPTTDEHEIAAMSLARQAIEELHDFAAGDVVKADGEIDMVVGGQPLRFALPPT